MGQFNVVIGDWSDDGHGKSDTFTVEVPDWFTPEIIKANYDANVDIWGFSPSDFASEYEDYHINSDHALMLLRAGLDEDALLIDYEEISDDHDLTDDDTSWDDYTVKDPDAMLKICMFFISHGLDTFTWKKIELPILFGGRLSEDRRSTTSSLCDTNNAYVGYGLYS